MMQKEVNLNLINPTISKHECQISVFKSVTDIHSTKHVCSSLMEGRVASPHMVADDGALSIAVFLD